MMTKWNDTWQKAVVFGKRYNNNLRRGNTLAENGIMINHCGVVVFRGGSDILIATSTGLIVRLTLIINQNRK